MSSVALVLTVSIMAIMLLVVVGASPTPRQQQARMDPRQSTDASSSFVTVSGMECGSVTGFTANYSNAWHNATATVVNFRGIPFAEPPIGPLRFAPTVPSTCSKWSDGNFNATSFGAFCYQSYALGSEDCLYLNIQVPLALLRESQASGRLFPVSFYIHGGSLIDGSGAFEPFGAFAAFAGGEGVVAVTINYRLGLLGFLAHSALKDPVTGSIGNYGIMDQIEALRWVQRNIKVFGGDPDRVTLAGQSSGGTSIFALLATPSAVGLFRGAVSLSGSPNITMSLDVKLAQDEPIVALTLNCSRTTLNDTAACLRSLPAEVIGSHLPPSWSTPGLFHMSGLRPTGRNFAGLVYVDGVVVATSLEKALRSGTHTHVTLIISSMGQECNLESQGGGVHAMTLPQWASYLNNTIFAAWGRDAARLAEDVYNAYLPEASVNPLLAYDSINADYGLSCANAHLARVAKSSHQYHAPIYVAVNQWPPNFPDTNRQLTYAYHTWDYDIAIMSSFDLLLSPQDLQLGELLRDAWYSVLSEGRIPRGAMAGENWLPVDEAVGFPAFYNTFVFSRPDRYPWYDVSRTRINYKESTCATLASFGFDQRFWWCD